MRIGLVTDSPADLPPDLAAHYGIEVIPAILIIEGREYVDGVDITREQFYARLPTMRRHPTTAAPRRFSLRRATKTAGRGLHACTSHLTLPKNSPA